jgi:hypothetical protein
MTQLLARGGVPCWTPLRAALCAAALLVVAAGCGSSPDATGGSTSGPVQPVIPIRSSPAPARTPALTLATTLAAGNVQIEPGPYTDRLDITGAALQPGDRPVVTAQLRNAVDVSGLILLELRADFYDTAGGYLGFGTAAYADEEFADSSAIPLPHGTGERGDSFVVTVTSDAPLTGASSAVLTVPQLVNE